MRRQEAQMDLKVAGARPGKSIYYSSIMCLAQAIYFPTFESLHLMCCCGSATTPVDRAGRARRPPLSLMARGPNRDSVSLVHNSISSHALFITSFPLMHTWGLLALGTFRLRT